MSTTIHIPSPLQALTQQQPLITLDDCTHNVLEALLELARHYPDIKNSLFHSDTQLNPYIRLCINNTLVSDLTTPLSTNDEIIILTAIAGG